MNTPKEFAAEGYYQNPVLRGNYADPSVIRVGEDYYMVHTSCKYVPGLIVWHSRDLVHWEPIGSALDRYNGDVWAPEMVYHKGLFYIYFPSNQTNWVTTASSPEGPWSAPVDLKTSYIDPGHVVGPDQKRYLHLSSGYIVELSDDGLSVTGEMKHVYDGWEFPDEWEAEGFALESPKLVFRDGYYYLTVAEGGTSGPPTGHMVVSSRSRTPWGPWEHSPYNPIVRAKSKEEKWWSQGHATIIDTPQGDWWMIYHAYENGMHTLGRHTLLLPVEWTEDGWFKVPDGIDAAQPIKKPMGEPVRHGWPLRDTFSGEKLGLQWQRFGTADPQRFKLENGALGITGNDEGLVSPLLYMVSDRSYEVEAKLSVEGEAEARLVLFYDESAYLGIYFSRRGVGHFRTYKKYKEISVESQVVYIRIRNQEHTVSFFYSEDGVNWSKCGKLMETSGFHHNTFGGYLSLRAGLDAVGEGRAIFTSFEYKPLA